VLRSGRFDGVVSTGSAVAMSFLPLARLYRKRAVYIESAARSSGPSLTGRLLAATPGTLLCTQYPQWATERWQYIGSVFDGFESERSEDDHEDHDRPLKVVVTLGLIVGYGFRRLIERLLQILPADADVLWQVGDTDTRDLPITAFRSLYWTDLRDAIADADVVVAHTGVGSALAALELGKCPVLVPRAASHDEHVDDHQLQIAVQLARRGLAVHRSVEALTLADLHEAMAVRVRDRTRELPPMRL
jgi:UDP-N-acetylglucosamine transferase subunit ALG13